ncbi:MAG: hypothetical protein SGJ05_10345 [bacterium]|nr:hypothetical protein [bacterium]
MTIYFLCDMRRLGDSLAKLSKHSASGGCLHIKKLSDIHLPTLKGMLVEAYKITPTEQISVSTKTKPASKKIAAKKVAAKKVAAKSTTAKKSTVRKGR